MSQRKSARYTSRQGRDVCSRKHARDGHRPDLEHDEASQHARRNVEPVVEGHYPADGAHRYSPREEGGDGGLAEIEQEFLWFATGITEPTGEGDGRRGHHRTRDARQQRRGDDARHTHGDAALMVKANRERLRGGRDSENQQKHEGLADRLQEEGRREGRGAEREDDHHIDFECRAVVRPDFHITSVIDQFRY